MCTYFSFGLILWDIPNSVTPQTTLRLLPIPVGLLITPCTRQCRRSPLTPSPIFLFLSRTEEVPVPMTGVHYNSLLWMCTLNTQRCDSLWHGDFLWQNFLAWNSVTCYDILRILTKCDKVVSKSLWQTGIFVTFQNLPRGFPNLQFPLLRPQVF